MYQVENPTPLMPSRDWFNSLSDSAYIRQRKLLCEEIVPFSASTLWRMVKQGSFPPPLKISNQITAWRVVDIRKWLKDPASYKAEVSV